MKFEKGQIVRYVLPNTDLVAYETEVIASYYNKAGRELIRFKDKYGNLQISRADCWELVSDIPQDELFQ